jgi:phytoene dehydrogenase-like protein
LIVEKESSHNWCGFSGLSAAAFLAKAGWDVQVVEKNTAGGRARQFTQAGFTFDMGRSWYWMPDVFEHFFARFEKKPPTTTILKDSILLTGYFGKRVLRTSLQIMKN